MNIDPRGVFDSDGDIAVFGTQVNPHVCIAMELTKSYLHSLNRRAVMDMMLSSTLLPVAGVLVQSHLQEIHGLLLLNGMFEFDIEHFGHANFGKIYRSELTMVTGLLLQKDLPICEL